MSYISFRNHRNEKSGKGQRTTEQINKMNCMQKKKHDDTQDQNAKCDRRISQHDIISMDHICG